MTRAVATLAAVLVLNVGAWIAPLAAGIAALAFVALQGPAIWRSLA